MSGEYNAYGKGGDIMSFRREEGKETVYSLQGWDGAEIRVGKGTEMMIAGIGYLLRHDGRACWWKARMD